MHVDEPRVPIRIPGGRRRVEAARDPTDDIERLRERRAGITQAIVVDRRDPVVDRTFTQIPQDPRGIGRVIPIAVGRFSTRGFRRQDAVPLQAVGAPARMEVERYLYGAGRRPLILRPPLVRADDEHMDRFLILDAVSGTLEPAIEKADGVLLELDDGVLPEVEPAQMSAAVDPVRPGADDELLPLANGARAHR